MATCVKNSNQYDDGDTDDDKYDNNWGRLCNDSIILGLAGRFHRESKWLSGDDTVPLWRWIGHRAAEWLEHQQWNWFLYTANANQHRRDSRWENKHAISGPRSPTHMNITATEDTFAWCIFLLYPFVTCSADNIINRMLVQQHLARLATVRYLLENPNIRFLEETCNAIY